MPKPWPLLALALALSGAARAQTTSSARLYVGPSIQIGSSRVIGLSGAFVGICEGGDGFVQNFAAAAQRHPALARRWDWDAVFSAMLPVSLFDRDLDNDGIPDRSTQSFELLAGALVQFGRGGGGAYLRQSTVRSCQDGSCGPNEGVTLTREVGGAGIGLSMWRDQLILGIGLLYAGARVTVGQQRMVYGGWSVEPDLLWRPAGRPFRLGLSYRQETDGVFQADQSQVDASAPQVPFRSVVSPSILSAGASFRLGEGAHRYNRLSPAGREALARRDPTAELPPPDPEPSRPAGKVLLTAQADLVLPTTNTVALSSYTSGKVTAVGRDVYLTPRFGVEWEALEHRLRLRGGSYVEPSPFPGVAPRVHATGGFELFVLRFLDDWSLSSAFDVAPRYYNVTVGVGFWN